MSYASREQVMKSACGHEPHGGDCTCHFQQISSVDRPRNRRTGRYSMSDATFVVKQLEKT
jgi:hypothetical protein